MPLCTGRERIGRGVDTGERRQPVDERWAAQLWEGDADNEFGPSFLYVPLRNYRRLGQGQTHVTLW